MFTTSDYQMLQCPPVAMTMESRWNKSNSVEIAPNCPRCASPNTKFCYYNNYSLSQPRYFCKGCRRYWTKGGSLRNVPVGGGCRKNRRSRSSIRLDRAGTSYTRSPPSPGRSSTNSTTVSHGGPEGSPDIDLAAVYASYLNQNSGSENNVVVDQDTSSGASCASYDFSTQNSEIQLENLVIDCENSFDLLDEIQLHEELRQVGIGEDNFQDFVMQNLNNFELPEEVPWNMDATNFPNFAWQPIVQMQEFGSFSYEDQLKISTNLVNDNWSSTSVDLSGYEIF